MTEFSDEIKKLEQDLKKAEKYQGQESAEFKALQETVKKLDKAQKENDYEHIERIVQHLIKEEDKMSDIEQKLDKFAKKINEELPYLEQAVDNKSEVEIWKNKLLDFISELKKELSENSKLFILLHSKDNWTGPEYKRLIVPIRNIQIKLSGLSSALHFMSLEFKEKKDLLKIYKESDESVAGDLKIARIISEFYNKLCYDKDPIVNEHSLYQLIKARYFAGGYINSRICRGNTARIKLKESYIKSIHSMLDSEDETNKKILIKIMPLINSEKEWKLSDEVVGNHLHWFLNVLYSKKPQDGRDVINHTPSKPNELDINKPERRVEFATGLIKGIKNANSDFIMSFVAILSTLKDKEIPQEYQFMNSTSYQEITERILDLKSTDLS